MLEELREVAGLGGPAAALANDLLVIRDQYEQRVRQPRATHRAGGDEALPRLHQHGALSHHGDAAGPEDRARPPTAG